ncbi:MAG TPA: hypothetical protein VFZ65_11985 [Planctomycetota bacterium]|nr:hypothetical protein [Planctomycetota bacterium]
MSRRAPFTTAGFVLTLVGMFGVISDMHRACSCGSYWNSSDPNTLLVWFPLCGIVAAYAPAPESGTSIALFVGMLLHWVAIGWLPDRWLVGRGVWA